MTDISISLTQPDDSLGYEIVQGADLPVGNSIRSNVQRVAIFTEAFLPKIDGVSRSALLTVRYLRATGRQVMIFAPASSVSQIDGIPVYRLPSIPLPFYPEVQVTLPLPMALLRTFAALRHFKPDIIQLFSPVSLGLYGALAGSVLHIPVIANYQTDLPAYMHTYGFRALYHPTIALLRWLHNSSILTLVPSAVTRAELHRRGFRRVRLWERGVDLERFNSAHRDLAWRMRLLNGRDPLRSVVLYVGRLAPDKHLTTLHALASDPNLALTIVGDGPSRTELEAYFAGTDTYFAGALYGDDLAQTYASADMFAFPGPEETFGQVVLEAMASGLPVIVPDRGGAHTLVRHGENGLICASDQAEKFATSARMLHFDPIIRAQIGQAARNTAAARPWLSVMQRLDGYYSEAIARYAGQPTRGKVLRTKRIAGRPAQWQADRAG